MKVNVIVNVNDEIDKTSNQEFHAIKTPSNASVIPIIPFKNIEKKNNNNNSNSSVENKSLKHISFFQLYRFATFFEKLLICIGCIFSIIHGSLFPLLAILFGDAINSFEPINMTKVKETSFYFFIVSIGLFISGYLSFYLFQISSCKQIQRIRIECFRHLLYQDIKYYDIQPSNELTSRISGDTIKIQEGMGEKLGEALRFIAQFLTGYSIGFYRGWNMSLVMASVMPAMAISLTCLIIKLKKNTVNAQKLYAKAGAIAEETISSMRTICSLNSENYSYKKYTEHVVQVEKKNIQMARFIAFSLGWFISSVWVTYAIGLWYGGHLVSNQDKTVTTPGQVFSAFYAILIGTFSLAQISPNITAIAEAKGAASEIFFILQRKSEIDSSKLNEGIIPSTVMKGQIEVNNIHFSYPNRQDIKILKGFSLQIYPGQTVALVGTSGGGKSTLISLLERFYDPSEGSILIDGVDIKKLQLKWLRSKLGLVSQEPVLFDASIYDNIMANYNDNDNISKEEIEMAAKLANAHDFIMNLTDKYDTKIGEGGIMLSGGQKQRIAIARALLRKPKILLLDEATSALDSESEFHVQKAINNLINNSGMTTIIIAHRLSTIKNADKIIVISDGVVKEEGNHKSLMEKKNGIYQTLVKIQDGGSNTSDNISISEDKNSPLVGNIPPSNNKENELIEKTRSLSNNSERLANKNKTDLLAKSNQNVDKENKNWFKQKLKTFSFHSNSTLTRILKINDPERKYLIFGIVTCCINGFSFPVSAILITQILTSMTSKYALFKKTNDTIYLNKLYQDVRYYSIIYLSAAFGLFFMNFIQTYSFKIRSEKLITRLRSINFLSILRQNISFFDDSKNSTGLLTSNLSVNATKVASISGETQGRMIQAIFTFIAALLISFILGSWLLSIVLLAVFPILILGNTLRSKQFKGNDEVDDELIQSSTCVSETLNNMRTVAAYGMEEKIINKYELLLLIPLKINKRKANINGIALGFSSFIIFAVYALTFWYGGYLVGKKSITFTQLIRSLMAIMMSAQSIGQATSFIGDTDDSLKAADDIFNLQDKKIDINTFDDLSGDKHIIIKGKIEFKNITFAYPTRPNLNILNNYNLIIKPMERVAFVGSSGSGKSTIVSLLERYYDPQEGSVLLDDNNIKTLNIQWLRDQIGMVGQEPLLFMGTIAENIAMGLSYKDKKVNDNGTIQIPMNLVQDAAKMANAHDFISHFPEGYQTMVGVKGMQLSGGQKQRIAIARAIIKDPSILLLDEATSALDSDSERVVQEALDTLIASRPRTTIIIAHRLSTIRNADKICVLHKGSIIEIGKHDELMAKNGYYTNLIRIQTTL